MRRIIFVLLFIIMPVKLLLAAGAGVPSKNYLPDLNKIRLVSCREQHVNKQIITALPLKNGAILIPVNKRDLSAYNRLRIKIMPILGNFRASSFTAMLRIKDKYSLIRRIHRPVIKENKMFEMVFNISKLPGTKVDFLRLYFNYDNKITESVKFNLKHVEFYKSEMFSKLPEEKYQRKLAKTFIFSRIQIKYNLFMNYYSVPARDLWIERPLVFNRELIAETSEYKKEGNLASFRENAKIVSSYLDGFSILSTSKSYLERTLTAMRYADSLGLKNLLMLEVSPAITRTLRGLSLGKDYDFILQIAKAAGSCPAVFRIKDKIVISSYSADKISPEQWAPVVKKLKKLNNNRILFIAEIRKVFYKANSVYKKNGGKVSSETIHEMKEIIRSYLDVADGILFAGCNHLAKHSGQISNYKFSAAFYKNILIPTIISVLNEPEYRGKYFGLSAAKGYFNTRYAAGGQNESGTSTLRQSLEAALKAKPDFIIMPEWNEAYENTHIEPTIYDSFTSRRIINYYRKTPIMTKENTDLPNLIISYRSELVYGENLLIELLNIPDSNNPDAAVKIEFCLKNKSGETIKRFEPFTLSNRKMDVKYIKIPTEYFNRERVLIPELSISGKGKIKSVKGLSCIMLKTPPNMNKKYVKQPIRDLCVTKQAEFQWSAQKDGVEVKGVLETESPLYTLELLENNIPVAAVDIKKEYYCKPGEILLRCSWNSNVDSTKAKFCLIKALSGTVDNISKRYIVSGEWKNSKVIKSGSSIHRNLRFGMRIGEFFFKASDNAKLEISVGKRKTLMTVAELIKFGVYRKVFENNDTITIEQVRRMPEVPYPVKRKRIDFTLKTKSIFPNPVYTIRAISESGKIFRSKPFYPEKLSGKKIIANAWSYSKQKAIALSIPEEYGRNVHYDFTPAAGDVLPTIPPYRFLYGKLGGFDRWNNFYRGTAVSAPAWKTMDNKSVLDFDGTGNYLMFPAQLISEQAFTLAFSLMPASNTKQVIFQTYNSQHPGFQLVMENGSLSGYFLNKNGRSFKFKTKFRLNIGKWNEIKICYDMKNISLKINDNKIESFETRGILYRQPCLILGGSYPPKGLHRFKGLLRSFSYANYVR